MNHACTYCGYYSLTIVRDYTGAPYGLCPRCYRRDPFYRFKPSNPTLQKTAASPQIRTQASKDATADPLPAPAPAQARP
jgi:hypothetical protein